MTATRDSQGAGPGVGLRILYLVHDLNDAAVARRVAMLTAGGAQVQLAGFYRGEARPQTVSGAPAISLGRSFDAQLSRRALSVVKILAGAGGLIRALDRPDLIIARNLEMLAIARRLQKGLGAPIVYECLDIHRLMLAKGAKGGLMRSMERRLLTHCALLIVSSPAFLVHYFKARQDYQGPSLLVENKTPAHAGSVRESPPAPPWRIGWFGMLRCSRSLKILSDLAVQSKGRVEVVLAGRPAYTEFDDFDAQAAQPGMRYRGPYKPEELEALYGSVHFTWAIDYFEEGLNSSWLLPNRLYEGTAYGAVPIALSAVQTGRWLADHAAGVLIEDPARQLPEFFESLDSPSMRGYADAVAAIAPGDLAFDQDDCRRLVHALHEVERRHDR